MIMEKTNIRIEFRIIGDDFEIERVTDMLKISPTSTWKRGDKVRTTTKKHKYTAWIYKIDTIETLDMNEQLNKLENIFMNKINELCYLKKQMNLDFCIDIVIIIEENMTPGIHFESNFIKFASIIGAEIDIDTYIN